MNLYQCIFVLCKSKGRFFAYFRQIRGGERLLFNLSAKRSSFVSQWMLPLLIERLQYITKEEYTSAYKI
jgi:hypothetical protein